LIDMKAVEKVEAHIADALKKGAKVVTGDKCAAQGGSFFDPTVLTDVTTDMVITKEETFGPVAPLYRFKTEEDAVKMANEAPTLPSPPAGGALGRGFAAYFYSRDTGRIWCVAEALEYGIVGINEGIISTEIAPFGGMKESGIGPIWWFTGAQNKASRNSSKSNTCAWAASTAKGFGRATKRTILPAHRSLLRKRGLRAGPSSSRPAASGRARPHWFRRLCGRVPGSSFELHWMWSAGRLRR
jgi:acyl-CoA reductase-like NAD-dependent aldehyde dehydrogenase